MKYNCFQLLILNKCFAECLTAEHAEGLYNKIQQSNIKYRTITWQVFAILLTPYKS